MTRLLYFHLASNHQPVHDNMIHLGFMSFPVLERSGKSFSLGVYSAGLSDCSVAERGKGSGNKEARRTWLGNSSSWFLASINPFVHELTLVDPSLSH